MKTFTPFALSLIALVAAGAGAAEALTENVYQNVRVREVVVTGGTQLLGFINIGDQKAKVDVGVIENNGGQVKNVVQVVKAGSVVAVGASAQVGSIYQSK